MFNTNFLLVKKSTTTTNNKFWNNMWKGEIQQLGKRKGKAPKIYD